MKTGKAVKKRKLIFNQQLVESRVIETDGSGNIYLNNKRITLKESVSLIKAAHREGFDTIDCGPQFDKWLDMIQAAIPEKQKTP